MNEIKLRLLAQRLLEAENKDMFDARFTDGSIEKAIARSQNQLARKIGDMLMECIDTHERDAFNEVKESNGGLA